MPTFSTNNRLRRVYYNLHLHCYSVQSKTERGWRLAFHAEETFLENATFKVYERARQKVIASQQKNVHAYVIGETCTPKALDSTLRVRYNPFVNTNFVLEDGTHVHSARYASFTRQGVFISGED